MEARYEAMWIVQNMIGKYSNLSDQRNSLFRTYQCTLECNSCVDTGRRWLELKDKVGVAAAWEAASATHAPSPEEGHANEAVLALIALGYKQVDAHRIVHDLQQKNREKSAEELVRGILKPPFVLKEIVPFSPSFLPSLYALACARRTW